MSLFMDIHRNMKGLTAEKLKDEHKKDLAVQGKHGVKFMNYWYNEDKGTIFCLYQAPDKEAGAAVHQEANVSAADEIFEVKQGVM
jgi:hypothetical protein